MTPTTFLVILVSGLSGAALLFLVGAGLTLVFGALRLINMAHGSLYMVGAFVAVSLVGALAGSVGFAVALVGASIAVGVLGGVIEVAVLRRLTANPARPCPTTSSPGCPPASARRSSCATSQTCPTARSPRRSAARRRLRAVRCTRD